MKAEQFPMGTGHLAQFLKTGAEKLPVLLRPPAVLLLLPPRPAPAPRPQRGGLFRPARPSSARTRSCFSSSAAHGRPAATRQGRRGRGRRGPARSQEGASGPVGEGRACGRAPPPGRGSPRPQATGDERREAPASHWLSGWQSAANHGWKRGGSPSPPSPFQARPVARRGFGRLRRQGHVTFCLHPLSWWGPSSPRRLAHRHKRRRRPADPSDVRAGGGWLRGHADLRLRRLPLPRRSPPLRSARSAGALSRLRFPPVRGSLRSG